MSKKYIEYKGSKGTLVMIGNKERVPGWRGELYVAVIQYGEKGEEKYDVIPDSTDPADVDDLPQTHTFTNRTEALAHFMKLEQNKSKWK